MKNMNWMSQEKKAMANKHGCIVIGTDVYAPDGNYILGTTTPETKIYRPDGLSITVQDMRCMQEGTLLMWSDLRDGFLCADIFCKVVEGFAPKFIENASMEADVPIIKLLNFITGSGRMTLHIDFDKQIRNRLCVKAPYIHIQVQHVNMSDICVQMSIDCGEGTSWIYNVNPEGGNMYLDDECNLPMSVYNILALCKTVEYAGLKRYTNYDWKSFMEV